MPGRIESPSTQLGQLLLRGYTMLAAACDGCQVPQAGARIQPLPVHSLPCVCHIGLRDVQTLIICRARMVWTVQQLLSISNYCTISTIHYARPISTSTQARSSCILKSEAISSFIVCTPPDPIDEGPPDPAEPLRQLQETF